MKMLKNYNLEYYPEEKILNPPRHIKNEIDLIFNNIAQDKNKKIVDFGSGGGRLTIPLLQNGFKVIAIDNDESSRKQLLRTATKIRKNKNLLILLFPASSAAGIQYRESVKTDRFSGNIQNVCYQ